MLFLLCISNDVVQYMLAVSIPWTFLNGTKALASCPSKRMVALACFLDYVFKMPNDGIVLEQGISFTMTSVSLFAK